jgi:hypothetical protein
MSEAADPGPRGRTRGGRRRPPRNSRRPQFTWQLWKRNPPRQGEAVRGARLLTCLGALDSMLLGNVGRLEVYRRKKGQES